MSYIHHSLSATHIHDKTLAVEEAAEVVFVDNDIAFLGDCKNPVFVELQFVGNHDNQVVEREIGIVDRNLEDLRRMNSNRK